MEWIKAGDAAERPAVRGPHRPSCGHTTVPTVEKQPAQTLVGPKWRSPGPGVCEQEYAKPCGAGVCRHACVI